MIRRILIVGLGSIGKRHIGILRDHFPNIEVIVLRHKDCNKEQTKKLGISYCVTSITDAIALSPQAAIIASPSSKHLEVSIQLASHGVHLLIEKPIANSSEGVEGLIKLCLEKNILLMIAYNLRYFPSLIKLHKYVQENKAGKILTVNSQVGSYLPSWRPGIDYSKSVSAQKALGGGVLLELSHEFDYLSWIFGKIKWVKAHVSKQSNLDIDTEDLANIILGFQSSDGSEHIATLNMNFFRHDAVRQCEIIGDDGTLILDFIAGEVKYFSASLKEWEIMYTSLTDRSFTYIKQIKHFFHAIDSHEYLSSSGEDALNTIKVIEAINESSNNNSIVYL